MIFIYHCKSGRHGPATFIFPLQQNHNADNSQVDCLVSSPCHGMFYHVIASS